MKDNTMLKVIVVGLVLIFVIHQCYSSLYKPVTTTNAVFCTATDGINTNATVIRQEQIITGDTSGSLHFRLDNGNRIAKGGIVADIYDDGNASITVNKIDEINKKIKDIEEISGYNDVAAADLELVNSKVKSAVNEYIKSCKDDNYSQANEKASLLLSAQNRKQFLTGEAIDFSAQLTALNSELASLSASLPAPKGSITANESGYFVSLVDGYESKYTVENLPNITPEFLETTTPDAVSQNAIGKIVSDYDWYIACAISLNDSLKYKLGDKLTLRTTVRNNTELNVTVNMINASKDSDKAVLIFSCQEMNSELATMRNGMITIVNKEYKGLKVPRKSLRVVDGETGVYVVSGLSVKFVKVNVIFSNEEFLICEQKSENSSDILRLYDEVVVKGKNLYDGKIIS